MGRRPKDDPKGVVSIRLRQSTIDDLEARKPRSFRSVSLWLADSIEKQTEARRNAGVIDTKDGAGRLVARRSTDVEPRLKGKK